MRRLNAEYDRWQKMKADMPGFEASPSRSTTGSVDYFKWHCKIPGLVDTPWEGGKYPLTIDFPDTFPTNPPKCFFPKGFLHINVFDSGQICLDVIKDAKWNLKMSIPDIMTAVQKLLNDPNPNSAANGQLTKMLRREYDEIIRKQAKSYR